MTPSAESKSDIDGLTAADHRTAALVRDAVQATVAYADIFDFSLSARETYRDLIGIATTPEETVDAISGLVASGGLRQMGDSLVLPGREGLAETRRQRIERARSLWPLARRIGRILSALPFVRMVAVTGSLAADNPDASADLDFLLIAVPRRLWLARALAVAVVRLARIVRVEVCPNYLLSTRALHLDRQDLYTAHELMQARPIAGASTYQQLRLLNAWTTRWLPNRSWHHPPADTGLTLPSMLGRAGEAVLGGRIGTWLEEWEGRRKLTRFQAAGAPALFSAEVCEGHFGQHRLRVMQAFAERCARLGITVPDGTH